MKEVRRDVIEVGKMIYDLLKEELSKCATTDEVADVFYTELYLLLSTKWADNVLIPTIEQVKAEAKEIMKQLEGEL